MVLTELLACRAFYWREMIYWCRARAYRGTTDSDIEMLGTKRAPAGLEEGNTEDLDTLNGMVKRCRCNDDFSPQAP